MHIDSAKYITRAVYMVLQVAFRLAATARVSYPATSTVRGTTSSESHGRCGRGIRPTLASQTVARRRKLLYRLATLL